MPARYGEQGYGQHQYVYSGNERKRQQGDKEEEDYGREGGYEQTGYGHGGQLVFAMLVVNGLCYLVSADEKIIHAHEVNIYNVIHKKEELRLSTW